ncbi:MAG: hypothetical protein CMK40_03450 [Porticoccaceae bacterium]|nr:hypothetical protein [Porticoccaceae bacterium]
MKKLLPLLILAFLSNLSFANFVDTRWKVLSYVGETWFSKPEDIIGKYQEFYKGWAEGVFYSCNYAGQSMTYNSYSPSEFLGNKEFSLFGEQQVELNEDTVYVIRITCNGDNARDRRVLYPFVTQNNSNKAYYLFEGAIFTLVDEWIGWEINTLYENEEIP